MAIEASKSSFDGGVKMLEKFTRAHVPKRQFEQPRIRASQDSEAFYAERQKSECTDQQDQQTDDSPVLTVDGKSVTMLDQDLRGATSRAAASDKTNQLDSCVLGHSLPKGRWFKSSPRNPKSLFGTAERFLDSFYKKELGWRSLSCP